MTVAAGTPVFNDDDLVPVVGAFVDDWLMGVFAEVLLVEDCCCC